MDILGFLRPIKEQKMSYFWKGMNNNIKSSLENMIFVM